MRQVATFKMSYDPTDKEDTKAYNLRAGRLLRAMDKAYPNSRFDVSWVESRTSNLRTVTYRIFR